MTRRNRPREPVPAEDAFTDLEAELHSARGAVADDDAAPVVDDQAAELDGPEAVLAYIRNHPGVLARDVIVYGRGGLSRMQAKTLVKKLLRSGVFRSEHPPGTNAYGRGLARLYADSPEASRGRLEA